MAMTWHMPAQNECTLSEITKGCDSALTYRSLDSSKMLGITSGRHASPKDTARESQSHCTRNSVVCVCYNRLRRSHWAVLRCVVANLTPRWHSRPRRHPFRFRRGGAYARRRSARYSRPAVRSASVPEGCKRRLAGASTIKTSGLASSSDKSRTICGLLISKR